jgi:hypothetical protein
MVEVHAKWRSGSSALARPAGTLTRLLALCSCVMWAGAGYGNELHPEGGSYLNHSGTSVDVAALRFTEAGWKRGRDQGFVVSLQKNTNYFYLWTTHPGAGSAGGKPLCDGYLLDTSGHKVDVNQIAAFAVGDLDGHGSTYLVSLVAPDRLIAWGLDGCENKAKFTPVAEASAAAGTGGGSQAPVWLVTGDFTDSGSESIQLITGQPAEISQWKLAGGRLERVTSAPLTVSSESTSRVTGVRYVTTTRLAHGGDNVAGESATIVLHDGGYTLYRGTKPIYYAPNCRVKPENCSNRVLLFDLDQGFSGGLQDLARTNPQAAVEAATRITDHLKQLGQHFQVWALLNPIQQDRKATVQILDTLGNAGIPFVLDYYSSDTTNLAALKKSWLDYSPRAFDGLKGVSLNVDGDASDADSLSYFAQRYGKRFAGVRFMERLGIDIQVGDQSFPQMLNDPALARDKLSFDWNLATRVLQWARQGERYVVWADPALYLPYTCYWKPDQVSRAASRRDAYVARQTQIAADNPYLIPMYDNNEGIKRCGVAKNNGVVTPRNFRLTGWERIPRSVSEVKKGKELLTGRHGFGISVQSWTTDSDPLLSAGTLPPEEMALWILDALNKGAGMVELEPYFYLFDWPKAHGVSQSRDIPAGEKAGDPRDTFRIIFADVLGE